MFIFDQNLNILSLADSLASEVKSLIDILQTTQSLDIQEQFQIELQKINIHDNQCITYRMLLRIDSILWFKYHILNDNHIQKLEHLYDIGCHYIEKMRDEIKIEYELKRLECSLEKKVEQKNPIVNLKSNERRISQTRSENIKLNGRRVSCVLQQDTVVKSSFYPYFIVTTQSDTTATITIKSVKQCSNIDYIQTCDAWQAVLQTLVYMKDQLKLNRLPLNYIYINCGNWMLQKLNDTIINPLSNAHINIVLTREIIEKIRDKPLLFPSLIGSILPLKTSQLDQSWKLIEYMNDHMTPILIKRNRELKTNIGSLKRDFEKLKQENYYLNQLLFN